jgi:hypothetical protein
VKKIILITALSFVFNFYANATITVYGRNEGTTSTTTSSGGTTTTTTVISCNNFNQEICYTVTALSGHVELEIPDARTYGCEGRQSGTLTDNSYSEDGEFSISIFKIKND